MKKYFFLFLSIFLLLGCEDVVDVDLPKATSRLVIDASVEREYFNNNSISETVKVKLSLTTPFFSQEDNFVNTATVTIEDIDNSRIYDLVNTGGGNYGLNFSEAPSFRIDNKSTYKLQVIYEGETYEALEKIELSTPFNEIKQIKNNNNLDEESIAVQVSFMDIIGSESYYFLDLGDANVLATDDEFFEDGKEIQFDYFFDENVTLDHTFKIFGSNKRFNTYVDALNELSNGDTNGPFATVPFKARGNIINQTNKENFAFGYFRVAEVYSKKVQLVPNKEFIPNN